MKSKLTAAIFTLMALPGAHAVDNDTLKSLAVGAGILTNTFAIYNRDQLDCRSNLQLGYQYGKDEELSAHSLNLSPMDCKMRAVPFLPQGLGFQVLPTLSGSVWNADSGPYAKQAFSDLSQRARLSFTYRHVSNADIQLPNNGVNFLGLGLTLKVD